MLVNGWPFVVDGRDWSEAVTGPRLQQQRDHNARIYACGWVLARTVATWQESICGGPLGEHSGWYLLNSLMLQLKGHSQLAHMRIRYHFIANLHITETGSILFTTRYEENNITGWAKAHSKTGFQYKRENIKKFTILYQGPRIWNCLPACFPTFKNKVPEFLLK